MSLFNKIQLEVTRYNSISIVNGRHVPGDDGTNTLFIKGTVQPISAKDMETLPENRRDSGNIKIYTSTKMLTSKQGQNGKADRLVFDNDLYEVIQTQPWKNSIIPHYKVIASRIDDKP